MRVKVRHRIDRLAAKQSRIPSELAAKAPGVVKDNADYGRDLAKALARAKAGPHGANYYKRISSEVSGDLGLFGNTWSAEYGPTGIPKSDFVGVGFRNGNNDDLPRSADAAGPALARDVRKMIGELFR